MSIGIRIKKLRELKGLTQKELAKLADVSRVAIGNYERGDRIPNVDILQSIASALEVPITEFFGVHPINNQTQSIDLSQFPTKLLIEELNRRDDFPIKLEVK